MPQSNDSEKREILMAGAFHQMPQLLDPVRENLRNIFDITREYIPRRKYDVTGYGYNAVVAVADQYFKAKRRSTDFADLFGGQTDKFLVDIYEELTALSRITINARDLQGTLQIVRCLQLIAIRAISFTPAIKNNDNFTCSMAAGYMKRIAIEALNVGVDDVGLEGVRALKDIESRLPKEYYYTTTSLVTDIYEIALRGLHQFYIVDEATAALVQIYKSRSEFSSHNAVGSTILDKIRTVAIYYLATNPQINVNCEGLGAVFSILRDDSLPRLIVNDLPDIVENRKFDVLRDIFHLYLAVAEEAAKRDSFLVHFIIQSIKMLADSFVEFLAENPNIKDKEEIFDEVIWLTSIYWRVYQNQPKDYKKGYIELTGIDNLVAVVLRSIGVGFNEFAHKLTDQIFSIVSVGLKKTSDEFTVPRLIVHAVKIGAVARTKRLKELADHVLSETDRYFKEFLARHKSEEMPKGYYETHFKERLSKEMWDLYLEFRDRSSRISPFDSDFYFYKMVSQSDLKNYLNEIEQKVYNRIIDDIHRRTI